MKLIDTRLCHIAWIFLLFVCTLQQCDKHLALAYVSVFKPKFLQVSKILFFFASAQAGNNHSCVAMFVKYNIENGIT